MGRKGKGREGRGKEGKGRAVNWLTVSRRLFVLYWIYIFGNSKTFTLFFGAALRLKTFGYFFYEADGTSPLVR